MMRGHASPGGGVRSHASAGGEARKGPPFLYF